MSGIGPITNTRTLKGALVETIDALERARQKPTIVKILQQCRDYRRLVDEWDSVSPPPDEQFETVGQIMQLLGAAMQATKSAGRASSPGKRDEPAIEVRTFEAIGDLDAFDDNDDFDDVIAHELELDLVPASSCAQVVELYREPWRRASQGIHVKTVKKAKGRHHALVRLDAGAELDGHEQDDAECILVLDGCIRHAGSVVHAGALLRVDAGAKSGAIHAVGEATILVLDTARRGLKI